MTHQPLPKHPALEILTVEVHHIFDKTRWIIRVCYLTTIFVENIVHLSGTTCLAYMRVITFAVYVGHPTQGTL